MTALRQLSLLDAQTIGAPYQPSSPTSIAAAQSIAEHAPTLRLRVLVFIREHGPCTQERIALETGIRLSTVCARVNELAHRNEIHDTGQTAPTTSGRSAVLWRAS